MSYELSNAPSLHLMISTEVTLQEAAQRARNKAAAFFGEEPEHISLHLKDATRDVDLESTSSLCEPGMLVESRESYHCSFKATVR